MDRRDDYHDDEAWIAKYRAALEGIPVQSSGGMTFRTRLRDICNVILLLLRKVLGGLTVWIRPKAVSSFRPMPVQPKPVLQTDSSFGRKSPRETSRKPSTRKSVETAERPGPPRPRDKRPAGRMA
jgi:hypothetical protein